MMPLQDGGKYKMSSHKLSHPLPRHTLRATLLVLVTSITSGCFTPGRIQGFNYNVTEIPHVPAPPIPANPYQQLAEKYAPVVYYDAHEVNRPADVDWFLGLTNLWYFDARTNLRLPIKHAPTPKELNWLQKGIQQGEPKRDFSADSFDWRDPKRQSTFFLETVSEELRKGCNPEKWNTYYHAYPNTSNGITIQYWRFYAFNSGFLGLGDHGGDWECAQVVLGADDKPISLRLLGHRDITVVNWKCVHCEKETHPVIVATRGSHTSEIPKSNEQLSTMIRHESHTNGQVTFPDGRTVTGGALFNLGEKGKPASEKVYFVNYSGLWGSPNTLWLNNGYWGPAFNETGMTPDGTCAAWCGDMKDPPAEIAHTHGP